jgi:hypothetical protein
MLIIMLINIVNYFSIFNKMSVLNEKRCKISRNGWIEGYKFERLDWMFVTLNVTDDRIGYGIVRHPISQNVVLDLTFGRY